LMMLVWTWTAKRVMEVTSPVVTLMAVSVYVCSSLCSTPAMACKQKGPRYYQANDERQEKANLGMHAKTHGFEQEVCLSALRCPLRGIGGVLHGQLVTACDGQHTLQLVHDAVPVEACKQALHELCTPLGHLQSCALPQRSNTNDSSSLGGHVPTRGRAASSPAPRPRRCRF
jgi:hypothetical protein